MSDYASDYNSESFDGDIEKEDMDMQLTDVCNKKSIRRRIEEYEESKWLRAALDDIYTERNKYARTSQSL